MSKTARAMYEWEAPRLGRPGANPAQTLGAAVWLWMQVGRYGHLSLQGLRSHLYAPLQSGHYALATRLLPDGQREPAALAIFARLSAQAEARYIEQPSQPLPVPDWESGDRFWIISWVAPRGDALHLTRELRRLLAGVPTRSLYHRGVQRGGQRLNHWNGAGLSPQTARQWWGDRPIQTSA
ncbi:toxin-activating lysine-acyltransferase [Leptospira sp. 96542]|nr:toxin-activating lysine-acyltransferase [Leptospira sp. 96542]